MLQIYAKFGTNLNCFLENIADRLHQLASYRHDRIRTIKMIWSTSPKVIVSKLLERRFSFVAQLTMF